MILKRLNIKSTLLILLLCVLEIIIIFFVFNFKTLFKSEEHLYSINVRGYDLDNEFSSDIYEYNLVVNDNIIEISCDSDKEIEGCNVSLDLTDKENYTHTIKVYDGKKTNVYTINIKNETKVENESFYIKSINGNTFEWTNKDINLEVVLSNEGVYLYSFDGGGTWQESNKLSVKENGKFQVVVKNSDGILTDIKNIEVDKIDKIVPQVTINKSNSTESKVTLEVSAYDELSGIDSISFNGGDFSSKIKYDVTKPGKYFVQAKDKAGNISDKKYIEIDKSDFAQNVEKKTYTLTLKGNGATVEKSSLSCTTTEGSCDVILPKIITSYTALGWATSSDSTKETYTQGQTIKLDKDLTLYAITKRSYTATFNRNGATNIGSSSLTCTAYNTDKCEITTPTITTTGTVIGWNTSSSSTTSKVGVNKKLELTGNLTLYAITKRSYTATFNRNGATDIGSTSLTCTAYNTDKCEITTPTITTTGTVIGWNTSSSSTTSKVGVNKKVELTGNLTLYAITKRTYTATFDSSKLDYLASSSLSCTVYNTNNSCDITLPVYNKSGYFNTFWSPQKEASSNLSGTKWTWDHINPVGYNYKLTGNITLYPNFNHFHYDLSSNHYKFRSINMSQSKYVGKTLFEFESGIPQDVINNFINSMNSAYNVFPWLFSPGKVFVMTSSTYSNYSIAYGLTHQMYVSYGGDAYFTIDLQYDTSSTAKYPISLNAALHELAHAWDSYYKFKSGKDRISSLSDFDTFYNSISSKLYTDSNGNKISKTETFAGMFTNYYWHVLGKDTTEPYYALKSGYELNSTEIQSLKTFMEKYINIAKNGY